MDNSMRTDRPDGAKAFDFLIGKWEISNRRLLERLAQSDEWETFPATLEVWPMLGGMGNMDQYLGAVSGKPIEGATLRLFNPDLNQWSLYWIDDWSLALQTPMVGKFKGNRGEFYGDETFNGRAIKNRFIWESISPNNARWEQAFSTDKGKSWETNWIMDFTRVE